MANDIPKRTKINAALYKELKKTNDNEFEKDFKQVESENKVYFSSIMDTLKQNTKVNYLYASQTLSQDEKYLQMHYQITDWLKELEQIIEQANNDDSLKIQEGNWYLDNQQNINQLNNKVIEVPSIREISETLETNVSRNYQKNVIVNNKALLKKLVGGDLYNNLEFKNALQSQKNISINTMTDVKRTLNNYKIKWIWYVIPLLLLLIGAILCIIVPIFV